jgi:hypothetical protein
MRLYASLIALLGSTGLQGCAALDAQAVAESHRLDATPYYVALVQPQPAPGSCGIVYAVTLDPELESSFGYDGRAAEFSPLLEAMNARLAQQATACIAVVRDPAGGTPPRVYVGSATSDYAPPEAAEQRLPTDRFAPMVLHIARPDATWRTAAAATLAATGAPYALVIQLGVAQYMKGYASTFRKNVALGTGHDRPIKFLTAEDKPVEVLHLTGVLVDATGKPVRAGAEGIVLRDTPFLAQVVDAERIFDAAELQRVLDAERRAELPGAPLNWEVALDNLVAQLLRREVRVPAR